MIYIIRYVLSRLTLLVILISLGFLFTRHFYKQEVPESSALENTYVIDVNGNLIVEP